MVDVLLVKNEDMPMALERVDLARELFLGEDLSEPIHPSLVNKAIYSTFFGYEGSVLNSGAFGAAYDKPDKELFIKFGEVFDRDEVGVEEVALSALIYVEAYYNGLFPDLGAEEEGRYATAMFMIYAQLQVYVEGKGIDKMKYKALWVPILDTMTTYFLPQS